jgi:hypothetical protein
MSWDDARRTLELNLAPGSRLLPPMPRSIDVHLLGQKQSKSFQGKPAQSLSRRSRSTVAACDDPKDVPAVLVCLFRWMRIEFCFDTRTVLNLRSCQDSPAQLI